MSVEYASAYGAPPETVPDESNVNWSAKPRFLIAFAVMEIGGVDSDFEVTANNPVVPPLAPLSGVAISGRYTVDGSRVHVTLTVTTLAVATPDPLVTLQFGPGGCVEMVTEYAAPFVTAFGKVNGPLAVSDKVSLRLFWSTTVPTRPVTVPPMVTGAGLLLPPPRENYPV